MKSYLLPILLLFTTGLFAQTTASRIYNIMQEKCATCHNAASSLNLEGIGNTEAQKMESVFVTLTQNAPANGQTEYAYLQSGRVDKSYLFRHINDGFEPAIQLESDERTHAALDNPLTKVEKELLRQWILHGLPTNREVVEESLLEDYYGGNGMASFETGAPAPPAPEDGFQIKMGPFFLEPGGELELFQKYQLDLPEDVDVHKMDINMGTFSHHFIIYDYEEALGNTIKDGYRLYQEHEQGVGFVTTVAESRTIDLPEKTAFMWRKNLVLDLNSHYINYSATNPYQAEVYVNVYTQPAGTAAQHMESTLIPYFNISIPNTGDEITQTASVALPFLDEIYVWTLGAHTHKYGTDYKVWLRDGDTGGKKDLIYDGSCPDGVPGCPVPYFDYQHIPVREFDGFFPLDLREGFIHEATWINDGAAPVYWGSTSEDEMMLIAVSYVTDTTGLNAQLVSNNEQITAEGRLVNIFPNPVQDILEIEMPTDWSAVDLRIFDVSGKQLLEFKNVQKSIDVNDLPKGMYIYDLKKEGQFVRSGKLLKM